MADDAQAQPQAQEQNFYRQYLQSTAPDGSTTIREIVSPSLLDHDAAVAAEKQAGYTFQNFVDPAKMSGVQTTATPPAQAQPEAPLLPSEVVPTSGAAPSSYTAAPVPPPDRFAEWRAGMPDAVAGGQPVAAPGSSPWLNMIPPAMAMVGPLALSIAQPEIGIPMWLASGALAAGGGGAGEAVREKLAGEELSARNIATQGAVSGLTDIGMSQVVIPYAVNPATKFVTGKLGRVLNAAEDLGPVLTSEGTTVTPPAASFPAPPVRVTGVHAIDLAAQSPETLQTGIQALAKQATAEERPAIAAAWVSTMRQRAANSGDPITYMRAAYDSLGEETQAALFGGQQGAYERMLQTAWSGAPGELSELVKSAGTTGGISTGAHYGARYLGVPALGMPTATGIRTAADLTAPFAARQMLVSPGAARFGAGLSRVGGIAAPAASNLAAQSVAERARQAGLPTF